MTKRLSNESHGTMAARAVPRKPGTAPGELRALFGLHRLALEDVINIDQRTKVEEFDRHLFMAVRSSPRIVV
jgi:hypothetical protein